MAFYGRGYSCQRELASEVITLDDLEEPVRYVAGVDVGFEQGGEVTRAAIAVLKFPELELIEEVLARRPTSFPYVPGLLSFRRNPRYSRCPGADEAHPLACYSATDTVFPRRLGIASHLGVLTGLPTLGVGKSILVGKHASIVREKGKLATISTPGEVIGAALCAAPSWHRYLSRLVTGLAWKPPSGT